MKQATLVIAAMISVGCLKPKDPPRKPVRLSPIKQMGTSLALYLNDYHDVFPVAGCDFKEVMFPYVKDERLFYMDSRKYPIKFNRNLGGLRVSLLPEPDRTVGVYSSATLPIDKVIEGGILVARVDSSTKYVPVSKVQTHVWNPFGKAFPNGRPPTTK